MNLHRNRVVLPVVLFLGGILSSQAQTPAPAPTQSSTPPVSSIETSGETVELPSFTVNSEKDTSYVGKQALSVTRVGIDLADLASSVVVLNKAFIDNASPTIMAKSLNYVGGAQTGTITWSVDRYMIRGFVGEGDYVDGFRTQTDKNTDLNLIDHIEIIKGPSAIFIANAANTVGGVINKVSKSPTSYKEGSLTVQYGRWDTNRADLDIGGPITADKKFTYRFLMSAQDSQGYFQHTYEKRTAILPMLEYDFSKDTQLWVKFETFDSHYSSYNGIPLDGRTNQIAAVPYNTNFDGEDTPNNWRTDWYYRLWGQFTTRPAPWIAIRLAAFDSKDTQRRVESILATVNTTQVINGVSVSVPGYQIPATYTPGTLLSRGTTAVNGDYQPRREIQHDYALNFDTGPISHKLLLGAVLVDYPQDTKTYSNGGTSTATSPAIDPFNPQFPTAVSVNLNQPPVSFNHITQNFAKMFVLETASILKNRVVANIGVTRSRYESSRVQNNYNQVTGAATADSNIFPDAVAYKNLVQYGLLVKPISNVSVFYDNSKNFAYNGFGTTPAGVSGLLPPSQGEQKELGVKSNWLENRLTFNVSYFNTIQFNNIVPAFPQTNPPSNVVVGGETSRGFDGDFAFKVNKNVDFLGSFAYFKAHIDLASPWNQIVQPGDGKVHTTIPVNNVAEHTLALWGRYNFTDAPLKGLSVSLGGSYLGKRAIDDNSGSQVFFGYLPARTVFDASIKYETKMLVYQLNIDNLLDKKYIYASRSELVQVPGVPRNFRISVTYKFW
ncbi:MAG TPA: TonB-dependent receptor plug domain-containing protein [Opitutaceae bacterium]|nr:TonB-dependent receptor plug domain-containing protein [Opitutaceae bacterium]